MSATKPALRSGSQPRGARRRRRPPCAASCSRSRADRARVRGAHRRGRRGRRAVRAPQAARSSSSDVRLPKRSGVRSLRHAAERPVDPTVPIVLVSAAAETEQRLHAFSRGADDYLWRNRFSPEELIARVRRLPLPAAGARRQSRPGRAGPRSARWRVPETQRRAAPAVRIATATALSLTRAHRRARPRSVRLPRARRVRAPPARGGDRPSRHARRRAAGARGRRWIARVVRARRGAVRAA